MRAVPMNAIMLAAGIGRRLKGAYGPTPKCLLEVGGQSLLERHLRFAARYGLTRVDLVVGFMKESIEEAISRIQVDIPVRLLYNSDYLAGNMVSLWAARNCLCCPVILMDSDVFYEEAIFKRLVASPHENCFLMDPGVHPSGEEMMLSVVNGRVISIQRGIHEGAELAGEGVGFVKLSAEAAQELRGIVDQAVLAGRREEEYEVSLNKLCRLQEMRYENIPGLKWIEIDFPEDLEKARAMAKGMGA